MPASRSALILRGTPRNLARLAGVLARGDVVAVPSETVYGLAADALNPKACRKIFQAKGRPAYDPLIVHIADLRQLDQLAERNSAAEKLAAAFWPGPLTMVLPKKAIVPDIVTSGRPSVAVRMPRNPLFRALIKRTGRPLAAPSANRFGYVSPTSAAHVQSGLGRKIPFILDGGPSEIGLESTIVDLRDPARPALLRPGAISAAQLSRVLGRRVSIPKTSPRRPNQGADAPGMLLRHYSPRIPVSLHPRLTAAGARRIPATEACLFLFRPPAPKTGAWGRNTFWLSAARDLEAAAHALFATLRRLDEGKWKRLHVELAPGKDALALAINDRLVRAAAKR
jgi:L-threonylcarbamoyladenylate synthase